MRSLPVVIGSLLFSAGVFAGPLNPDFVAKDAQWLAHVDMERFIQSKIGACLLDDREHFNMDGVEEIKEALGIDVLHDVLSITLYSSTDDGAMGVDVGVDEEEVHVGAEAEAVEGAVVVAVMTEAADRMIEKLKADESYAEVRKDDYVLHSFVEPESDQRHNVYVQRGANANQRIVVAGPDVEHVVEAINVVAGKAESLNGDKAALGAAKPRAGSFLFSTALEIEGLGGGDNPASRILDCSRQVTFDLGETEENVYAALEVAADSEQDALNISQILQGLVALGRMAIAHHHDDNEHALKLLNAISIHTREDMIVAGFAIAADECCELLKLAAEEHPHHHDDDDEWIEDDEPDVEDAD